METQCRNSEAGMTLSEILIVVVIIGVLGALTLPRFFGQSERATVAEATQMLSAIRHAEEAWLLEQATPAYTSTLANLDLVIPAGDFTYTVTVSAGPPPTFTATAARVQGAGSGCTQTGATPFAGCTVTLDNSGGWGGTYPTSIRPS